MLGMENSAVRKVNSRGVSGRRMSGSFSSGQPSSVNLSVHVQIAETELRNVVLKCENELKNVAIFNFNSTSNSYLNQYLIKH